MQGGETVSRICIDGCGIMEEFTQPIGTAQRRRFEDVEFRFLRGYSLRQLTLSTIDQMHEKAHSVRVSCSGRSRMFFQQASEAVHVPGLEQFEAAFRVVHV